MSEWPYSELEFNMPVHLALPPRFKTACGRRLNKTKDNVQWLGAAGARFINCKNCQQSKTYAAAIADDLERVLINQVPTI